MTQQPYTEHKKANSAYTDDVILFLYIYIYSILPLQLENSEKSAYEMLIQSAKSTLAINHADV